MTYTKALEIVNSCVANGTITVEAEDYAFWETISKALEKQIPKKPILQRENNFDYYYCPICEAPLNDYFPMNRVSIKEHHCVCGQKIDWGEDE